MTKRWRQWCIRACCLFGAVYLIGLLGVPTQIPYIAALLIAVADAIAIARRK